MTRGPAHRLPIHSRRARRTTLAATLALALFAVLFGSSAAEKLSAGVAVFQDPSSESAEVRDEIFRARGYDPDNVIVALVRTRGPAAGPGGRARVRAVARVMRADPSVSSVTSFTGSGDRTLISRDGRATYVLAGIGTSAHGEAKLAAERLRSAFADDPGVTLGGNPVADVEFGETISADLRRAELIVLPLLLLLLILIFRGVVAAFLPVAIALLVILGASVGLRVAGELTTVSIYALNLAVGLGLGLATDYSLLMVSRYREEVARSGPGEEALTRTMRTAGRTVLFSSLTVAGVLASLLIFPEPFLYSMGIAGVLVALLAGAASLLVLPAILGSLGERVNALSPRRRRGPGQAPEAEVSPGWGRLARRVMRHPAPVALVTAGLLLALGASALRVDFTFGDPGALPESAEARQAHDALQSEFALDRSSPLLVTAEAAPPQRPRRAAAELTRRLRAEEAVDHVVPFAPSAQDPSLLLGEVVPSGSSISPASERLLERVRALPAPAAPEVGGYTAAFADLKESIRNGLPAALALISAVMLVLIFAMTRSVLLPVKTLLLNLLTISATLGILTLVFQDGRLESLLGYSSEGAIGTAEPVVLVILAFAISTDYAVFLLARIKEEHDRGAGDVDAVAWGLERTGRIVTAAALLLAVAVGALVLSGNVYVKQLGIGAAAAVLIDATVVRGLLVPSLMAMLGRWNWWAPSWLQRTGAAPPPAVIRDPWPKGRGDNQREETEA